MNTLNLSNSRWVKFFSVIVILWVGLSAVEIFAQDATKNSTKKIRVQPSPTSSRIGSAVNWQPDFETALAESAKTGKPIFWYVPTLRGSFMDRLDSIDRYMLAGPFSWPTIIELLNKNFVPVKAQPNRQQQTELSLKPYVFVEPGFVVLDSSGNLVRSVDRLTTLHPIWLRALIASLVESPVESTEKSPELAKLWQQFAAGEYEQMVFDSANVSSSEKTETLLLAGMVRFRLGDHDGAKEKWLAAAAAEPEHPLAWKAAAEAEGFGPFVRGFEVHGELPESVLNSAANVGLKEGAVGSAAPREIYSEDELWRRSIEFLLSMQHKNGAWTDCDYDFGGTDSLPNVHVAVTSIAGLALISAKEKFIREQQTKPPANSAAHVALLNRIENAIENAAAFVGNDQNLNRVDRDELLWADSYRVRLLARMATQNPGWLDRLKNAVRQLELTQMDSGGWYHEYDNPFVTASALLALKCAEDAGATPTAEVLAKGYAALTRDRFGNGAYPYSSVRSDRASGAGTEQHIAASAGRMPVCELALWRGGKSDDATLANAVRKSLELNENLMKALKYDNHTSNLAYGGFFFWYDFHGRTEAIARVADANVRADFAKQQRKLILGLPEIDGCFVDSHELGRVYGTSMALLSLVEVQ